MVSEWKKFPQIEGYIEDWDRIFLIPTETGNVTIYYGDEYCTVYDVGVQELVDKLKSVDGDFMATKGAMKSLIRNALNN